MPLLGQLALWMALLTAVWSAGIGAAALRLARPDLAESARRAGFALCVALAVAVVSLLVSLLGQDYNIAYVAAYADRAMPDRYRWAALYAGPEGRLLYWTTALAVYGVVARRRDDVGAPIVGALIAVAVGALVAVQNPFARLAYTPVDGGGLPAELQDAGMLLYPPLLYAALAAAMVPFARAIGRVAFRSPPEPAEPGAVVTWLLLSAAMGFGLWWSYRRLGWEASWRWDPVRSQALPLWLSLTALLHTRRVTVIGPRVAMVNLGLALATGVLAAWAMFAPSAFDLAIGVALVLLFVVIGVAAAVRVGRSHRAATYLGHVGAGLVVVVLAAQSRGTSREVGLSPGQSATVPLWRGGALTFTYLAASRYPADNRIVAGALIEVRNGERRRGRLAPTQNQLVDIFGNDRSAPVGRAAVLSGIGEDAYAALVSVTGAADVAVLRLAVHPLITWLWVGILLTMAGGVLTLRSRTDGA